MYQIEFHSVEPNINEMSNEMTTKLRKKIDRKMPSWVKGEVYDAINMRLGSTWSIHSRIKHTFYDED